MIWCADVKFITARAYKSNESTWNCCPYWCGYHKSYLVSCSPMIYHIHQRILCPSETFVIWRNGWSNKASKYSGMLTWLSIVEAGRAGLLSREIEYPRLAKEFEADELGISYTFIYACQNGWGWANGKQHQERNVDLTHSCWCSNKHLGALYVDCT